MRLPRVRFTLRRLMLVVAIVSALLAAFEAGRRWERSRSVPVHYTVFRPSKRTPIESLKQSAVERKSANQIAETR